MVSRALENWVRLVVSHFTFLVVRRRLRTIALFCVVDGNRNRMTVNI